MGANGRLVVFVDEEYGFRSWLWIPDESITEETLKGWQRDGLPVPEADGMVGDPWEAPEFPGQWVRLEVYTEANHFSDFSDAVAGWFMHLHEADDSWIASADSLSGEPDV